MVSAKSVLSGTKSALYSLKLCLYGGLLVMFSAGILFGPWPLKIPCAILQGAMFAHGIELQHELLHQRYYPMGVRRAIGFWLGLPMLVDFARYTATHSHHHRMLGTPEDEESFTYDFSRLDSVLPLVVHFSMVSHYRTALQSMAFALTNRLEQLRAAMGKAGPHQPTRVLRQMQQGYIAMAAVAILALVVAAIGRTTLPLQLWAIPLAISGPVHALIELPEHWNCNLDSTSYFANTRTIYPSPLMAWFANGNCWHVEHHHSPALGMEALPELHGQLRDRIVHFNNGYLEFYVEFWRSLQAA